MSQNILNPSFRFPGIVLDPSVPKAVSDVIRLHANALTDIYQAIPALKSQIDNLTQGQSTTTVIESNSGGGGGGGGGNISGLGSVRNLQGETTYTNQPSDNGALLIFGDASPVAVQLSSGISSPYLLFAQNWGAGVVTFTPSSGTISSIGNPGAASMTLAEGYSTLLIFDGTNWWAGTLPMVPVGNAGVAHEWIASYDAATGVFTLSQPAFADISGVAETAQIGTGTPSSGKYVDGGTGAWTAIPPSPGFPGEGLINDQSGQTSYATVPADNGILLILNDASPVAVTLTTTADPYYLFVTNFGVGTATLTPSSGTINGGASLSLLQNQTVYVACDSTNWKTSATDSGGGITQLTGDVTAGPGSGSEAATLKVATVGWTVLNGSAATSVGNIQSMLRETSLSECFLTVTASDAATDLTFDIQQNGVSVFTAASTVTHGATAGQQFTFALKTVPLPVAKNDKINLNITAGTSSWKISLVLR